MTKERKLEILKDLLIQLSDSANILCTCEADERCEVVEEYIKALEQQPSDDCVSRQAIDQNIYDYAESNGLSYANLKNAILDVPPVTPTHGTCKDCRNASESHYNKCIYCSLIERNCSEDFYCKEYKKRGDLDGSN